MCSGSPKKIVLVLACALAASPLGETNARAQTAPAAQTEILDNFFKLGLPDSRGAKWVRVSMDRGDDELVLPGAGDEGYSGNAWLLHEEKDGTVELIFNHAQRLRARRVKEDEEEEKPGGLPRVEIQEANLTADVQRLTAALQPTAKKDQRSVRINGEYLSGQEARPSLAGGTILFCAHLQHQGRPEPAGGLLAAALVFAGDPTAALNSAVSQLAGARLWQLTEAFGEKGDRAAYAQAIEKLAAEFPRGWPQRDAALFLAQQAREQKAAPVADDPAAKKAAEWLLALKRDKVSELPVNVNWLMVQPEDWSDADERVAFGHRGPRSAPRTKEAPNETAAAFFAEPRKALPAIARLLDDHRLTRLRRGDLSDSGSSSYYGRSMSREERIRQEYRRMDRPMELRELAWALLSNVLPDNLRSEIDDEETGRAEAVLNWFATIAKLSEDELAWTVLRESDSVSDSSFSMALEFLIRKGNAESLKRLEGMFLDPAVWAEGGSDYLYSPVEAYAAKLGDGANAFGAKLHDIVAAAIKAQTATALASMGSRMNAKQREEYERRADSAVQKFDRIFKRQGFPEFLAELVAADKETIVGMWEPFREQVAKIPWPEAEAQIYQNAPKAQDPTVRASLIAMIMQQVQGGRQEATPPASLSDATRAAVQKLLTDATPMPSPVEWIPSVQSIGDFTAVTFLLSQSAENQGSWMQLLQQYPECSLAWVKSSAGALAAGQPAPPVPSAKKVAAGRAAELVKELAQLKAREILPALHARTPDEQIAVLQHLGELADWPPVLLEARLTLTDVSIDDPELARQLDASRWKGRRLDEALGKELAEATEKLALDGHACSLAISPRGVLGGLTIQTQEAGLGGVSKQTLEQARTPLLEGKPAPEAISSKVFMTERDPNSLIFFSCALWKNPELTQAWREKFARPGSQKGRPPLDRQAMATQRNGLPGAVNDPEPYEAAVRDLAAGKPAARKPFTLWWMARPVKEAVEPDEEN